MKFSESWLREWVQPAVSVGELTERLTMAGLEVDAVSSAAPEFTEVVIAEVVAVTPHQEATRLSVCQVSDGVGAPWTVVCGAPNVRAGMRVALARVGARLPDREALTEISIRGVLSAGMMCSNSELGLGDEAGGILELPVDAPLGA